MRDYTLPDGTVQQQWDHLEDTLISNMKKYIPYIAYKPVSANAKMHLFYKQ